DEPLSLRKFKPLLRHILERADFATDLFIFSPVSQDTLDYTGGRMNEGSKAILMGLGEKRFELQPKLTAELRSLRFSNPRVYTPGVLVVEGPPWSERDGVAEDLLREEAALSFRLVIIVDDAYECIKNDESFLWTVFTRFDPASDITPRAVRVEKFHPRLSSPLVIDCRFKPWYPPMTVPTWETIESIDARWHALMGN
ncbi:MAG: 4-hydroxybenzoate decarboxylase, partial [Acidobacteria bacterium]|nr:4-hydroxybenzoate decarboxylase [Acidobacteriota bacterium]